MGFHGHHQLTTIAFRPPPIAHSRNTAAMRTGEHDRIIFSRPHEFGAF